MRTSILVSATALAIACTFGKVWSYEKDPAFQPIERVAAISGDHAYLLNASYVTGPTSQLRLYTTRGDLVDTYPLPEGWLPRGAATYHGDSLEYFGRDVADEAMWVLHENGIMLPWFAHEDTFGIANRDLVTPPVPDGNVITVTYLDITQASGGDLYLLTQEHRSDTDRSRLWRLHDGEWTSVAVDVDGTVLNKAHAVSYDALFDEVYVLVSQSAQVTLVHRYSAKLVPENLEIVEGGVYDIESLGTYVFLSTSHTLQIRDPMWNVRDTVNQPSSLALALEQPVPLRDDSEVFLWTVGYGHFGHRLHRYQLDE